MMQRNIGGIGLVAPDYLLDQQLTPNPPIYPMDDVMMPPVYDYQQPDPIKGNVIPEDDQIQYVKDTPVVIYAGSVVDSETGSGIPYATIFFYTGGAKSAGGSTDAAGNFNIGVPVGAETISISSVGYKPMQWPASSYQQKFELEKDIHDIDPVVLPPGVQKGKYGWLLVAGLGYLVYQESKKKR